jgi:prefoldin subunit 5
MGVIVISLISVSLAYTFSEVIPQYFTWVAALFTGFLGLLAILIWGLVSPILSLIIRLMNNDGGSSIFIQQIADRLEQLQDILENLSGRISDLFETNPVVQSLLQVVSGLKGLLLWIILCLVIGGILLWIGMAIWKERKRRWITEQQEAMLGQGDLWKLLKNTFRRQWDGLMNNLSNAVDFRQRARLRAAIRIRQVYADLLSLCEDLGHRRSDAQTPLEYLPGLKALFAEQWYQAELITRAYLKVRYGELPETLSDVTEVENAWKALEKKGRELMVERKRQINTPGFPNHKNHRKPQRH